MHGKVQNEFDKELAQAKYYIEHPDILRREVDDEIAYKKKHTPIHDPYPDLYEHRMTYYKGFVRDPERLRNYLKAIQADNSSERDFFPFIMDVEPNRTCNFTCTMCLHGQDDKVVLPPNMTYDDLVQFLKENPYIMEVKLHGLGEPLLVKGYEDMIKYLINNDIWSRMVTNGSLLHIKERYKKLVDMGIGEIQCSFDGTTKETLESIRRGSKWDKVFNNFKNLNNYVNKQDRLITRMWAVIQKQNRHQLYDFVETAADMEFRRLSVGFVQTDWGDDELRKHIKDITPDGIGEDEKYMLIERGKELGVDLTFWNQTASYSSKKLCPWVFKRPYITAEWKVVPCCIIGDPKVKNFGDAKDLKEIWKSKEYMEFRRMHMEGNIPEYCKGCYE